MCQEGKESSDSWRVGHGQNRSNRGSPLLKQERISEERVKERLGTRGESCGRNRG